MQWAFGVDWCLWILERLSSWRSRSFWRTSRPDCRGGRSSHTTRHLSSSCRRRLSWSCRPSCRDWSTPSGRILFTGAWSARVWMSRLDSCPGWSSWKYELSSFRARAQTLNRGAPFWACATLIWFTFDHWYDKFAPKSWLSTSSLAWLCLPPGKTWQLVSWPCSPPTYSRRCLRCWRRFVFHFLF